MFGCCAVGFHVPYFALAPRRHQVASAELHFTNAAAACITGALLRSKLKALKHAKKRCKRRKKLRRVPGLSEPTLNMFKHCNRELFCIVDRILTRDQSRKSEEKTLKKVKEPGEARKAQS